MKISELIEQLNCVLQKHGDLDIRGFADGRGYINMAIAIGGFKDTPESEPREVVVIEF